MRVVSIALALAVSLVFADKLSAADQTATLSTRPERRGDGMGMGMMMENMLGGLNLTDEQKAKFKELRKEYEPKFKEAADSVLTADQKKARDDAIKAAKDADKKGPEMFRAVRSAVKLTDEQKAKRREVMEPLMKEFREKVKAILTPEQQEQLKAKIAKHKAECK